MDAGNPGQNRQPDEAFAQEDRRAVSDHDAYFNAKFEQDPVYIEPLQCLCSDSESEMIIATVGSGVAVSFYDTELKIGALTYVLIPENLVGAFPYFDRADPEILKAASAPIQEGISLMKQRGAGKNRIRVRLMGGTMMPDDAQDAGTKNYIFVREYITRLGLPVLNEDLGGPFIRRIHFFPATGRTVRLMLRRTSDFEEMKALEASFKG